jgi:hypothetical protein
MKLTKSFRRILLKLQLLPFALGLRKSAIRNQQSALAEFTNIGEGTYENGHKSYLPDVVTTQRYLLYMRGSDTNHCTVATAGASPLGPCDDQADENDIPITINLLGAVKGTVRVVTDGSINDGSYVKCAANGVATAASAGDVSFGIAVIPTDCTNANGDTITIIPMAPAKYQF